MDKENSRGQSRERGGEEMEQDDRWAVALYDFAGDEERQILSCQCGDIVLVSPRDSKDWWPANLNGKFGFLPKGYLKLKPIDWSPEDLSSLSFRDSKNDSGESMDDVEDDEVVDVVDEDDEEEEEDDGDDDDDDEGEDDIELELAVALYSFQAQNEKQLSFQAGQEFYVCPSENEKWWVAEIDGKPGLVPFNYVRLLDGDAEEEIEREGSMTEGGGYRDEDEEDEVDSSDLDEDDDDDDDESSMGGPSGNPQLGSLAICQYDFIGREEGELSFAKGDFVWVNPIKGMEWWTAQNDRGVSGIVPCNYLKIVNINPDSISQIRANSVDSKSFLTKSSDVSAASTFLLEDHRKNVGSMLFFRTLFARSGVLTEESFSEAFQDEEIFKVARYDDGEIIFSGEDQNRKPIDSLYIVVQGRISVTYHNAHLYFVVPGQWFGESFLLKQSHKKTPVSFRANGFVTTLVLDQNGLSKLSAMFPSITKDLQRIAEFRTGSFIGEKCAGLFSAPPSSANEEQLPFLCDIIGMLLKFKQYDSNEILFQAGDSSREMYIVINGEAHILDGNRYVGTGDTFGIDSLIHDTPRTSTVVITKSLIALVLDARDLASVIEAIPEAEMMMKDFVWKKSADALRKIPFFASVPYQKLDKIASVCRYKSFAQSETIISAGLSGSDFYLILQGTVEVVLGPDMTKRLGPFDYFGELAILNNKHRSATVRVKHGPCRCLMLDGTSFRTFLMDCPEVKRDIVEKIRKRARHGSIGYQQDEIPADLWITGTIESLAGIDDSANMLSDQEAIDAFTIWEQIGQAMKECHILYDCWPIYLVPAHEMEKTPPNYQIYIKVVGLDEQLTETTVSVNTANTVFQATEKAFQNAKKSGRSIDPGGPSMFGFKVQSRNDFLVYPDLPLYRYQCIADLVKSGENRINLALVDLRTQPSSNGSGVHALRFIRRKSLPGRYTSSLRASTRTLSVGSEDSASILSSAGSESEEMDAQLGNMSYPIDSQGVLPGVPKLKPQDFLRLMLDVTGKAMGVKDTWAEVNRVHQVPTSKVSGWPFRINILGVHDMPRLTMMETFDALCIQVELVHASEVLEQYMTKTFPKTDQVTIRLEEVIWFKRNISDLPLDTRLCITMYEVKRSGLSTSSSTTGSHNDLSTLANSTSSIANAANATGSGGTNISRVLGGASIQVFDQRHILRMGSHQLVVWPNQTAERSIFCVNHLLDDHASIMVNFDEFLRPLYYKLPPPVDASSRGGKLGKIKRGSEDDQENNSDGPQQDHAGEGGEPQEHSRRSPATTPTSTFLNILKWPGANSNNNSMTNSPARKQVFGKDISPRTIQILGEGPLYKLSREDRVSIWEDRERIANSSDGLYRILQSADWSDPQHQRDALELLGNANNLDPFFALSLLDCTQGDYRVREYAVRCLETIPDNQLVQMLNQLTQVLKYEPYHESPLARFMLRRALGNPRGFGTRFFWSLRAEMHHIWFSQRFGILLRTYLTNSSPGHLQDLSQQLDVQNLLIGVANDVQQKKFASKMERSVFAQNSLAELNTKLPSSFQLPLNPQIVLNGLETSRCRVMNSKKKPLWLEFTSVDPVEGGGLNSLIMFKSGDDLRQDQMTLQMLSIMNQIWLMNGLDLRLTLYGCISTGDQVGFIEIVTNAETTAGIQKKHGKFGALSARSLRDWLADSNYSFEHVVDNFVHSCAGYCVATYVLGIGDRHSDNIMIRRDGKLFHIDFGHFLGHFKSKFGVKRERAPFVFTKEMAYVMGGKNEAPYRNFVNLCCRAYNILRSRGSSLIHLFRLMIPAGMPELQTDSDINYLCTKLMLDKTEEEAAASFKKEINNSLNDTYRRLDNLIHNIKTGN